MTEAWSDRTPTHKGPHTPNSMGPGGKVVGPAYGPLIPRKRPSTAMRPYMWHCETQVQRIHMPLAIPALGACAHGHRQPNGQASTLNTSLAPLPCRTQPPQEDTSHNGLRG